jgi:hypothetical protein
VDKEDLEISHGVQLEFDWAVQNGLRIFYDVGEVPVGLDVE